MSSTGVSSILTISPTLSAGVAMITPKLTTTFTPTAASCTGDHFTMLENREFEIWMNMPVPVPGTTITDCYPDVFMQSFLSSAGGITQPAFQPLVCPQSYSAVGPYTSNYIACCPSGYGFAGPKETPFPDRPAFGGTCYTNIEKATPIVVTRYGTSAVIATTTFSAADNSAQAYAYPYEGTAFGVAQLASITPATSSGAAAATGTTGRIYTVLVAAGPSFIPNFVTANVGDSVVFEFASGNHTLTQSTFDSPCKPLANGFDSGFTGTTAKDSVVSVISVNVSTPQFYYSKQGSDCSEGMTFALNPSTAESAAAFRAAAIAQSSPSVSTGLSVAAKAAIALGCIAGFGSLCLIALFFLRRRRQALAVEADHAKGVSEYSDSHGGPSRMTLNSDRSSSLGQTSRSVFPPVAPVPPPKGEELHGFSSPTELATYNQDAAVELQGSEGGQFTTAEKDNNINRQSFSPPAHIPELSPQNRSDDESYPDQNWPNEKDMGTINSPSTEYTESVLYSPQQPRESLPRYEMRTDGRI